MKKRMLALLLALAMVFSLAACGSNGGSSSAVGEGDQSSSNTSDTSGSSTTAEKTSYASAEEALAAAQACYDSMKDLSGDELLAEFKNQQAALNYDGNTDEFLIDPSTSLVDGFTDAVTSVEENQIALSGQTDYGYFVVLHLPLGDENLSEIKDDYINSLFSVLLNDAGDASEVVFSDALENLDYTAYLENLTTLQTAITDKYSELSEAYTAIEGNEDADSTTIATAVEDDLLATLDSAAVEDCVSYLSGGALNHSDTGLTVDGFAVPNGVYLYFLGYYYTYYKNMLYYYYSTDVDLAGEYSDDMTWLDFFKATAQSYTVQYATAIRLAQENGITLSDEELAQIDETLGTALESNTVYAGGDFTTMRVVLEYGLYGDAYEESIYGENGTSPVTDEDAQNYASEEGYYNCRYILFSYEEDSDTSDDSSDSTESE